MFLLYFHLAVITVEARLIYSNYFYFEIKVPRGKIIFLMKKAFKDILAVFIPRESVRI